MDPRDPRFFWARFLELPRWSSFLEEMNYVVPGIETGAVNSFTVQVQCPTENLRESLFAECRKAEEEIIHKAIVGSFKEQTEAQPTVQALRNFHAKTQGCFRGTLTIEDDDSVFPSALFRHGIFKKAKRPKGAKGGSGRHAQYETLVRLSSGCPSSVGRQPHNPVSYLSDTDRDCGAGLTLKILLDKKIPGTNGSVDETTWAHVAKSKNTTTADSYAKEFAGNPDFKDIDFTYLTDPFLRARGTDSDTPLPPGVKEKLEGHFMNMVFFSHGPFPLPYSADMLEIHRRMLSGRQLVEGADILIQEATGKSHLKELETKLKEMLSVLKEQATKGSSESAADDSNSGDDDEGNNDNGEDVFTTNFAVNEKWRKIYKKYVQQTLLTNVNFLKVPFFSQTPYRLGHHHIVKFKLQPASCAPPKFGSSAATDANIGTDTNKGEMDYVASQCRERGDDFNCVRQEMANNLEANGEACLDLLVIPFKDDCTTPTEDPTNHWTTENRIRVAKLRITADDIMSDQTCDDQTFNIWHTLWDHEPIGSVNRARKTVYQEVFLQRSALNADRGKDGRRSKLVSNTTGESPADMEDVTAAAEAETTQVAEDERMGKTADMEAGLAGTVSGIRRLNVTECPSHENGDGDNFGCDFFNPSEKERQEGKKLQRNLWRRYDGGCNNLRSPCSGRAGTRMFDPDPDNLSKTHYIRNNDGTHMFTWIADGQYCPTGGELDKLPEKSLQMCMEACAKEPRCRFFTFLVKNGTHTINDTSDDRGECKLFSSCEVFGRTTVHIHNRKADVVNFPVVLYTRALLPAPKVVSDKLFSFQQGSSPLVARDRGNFRAVGDGRLRASQWSTIRTTISCDPATFWAEQEDHENSSAIQSVDKADIGLDFKARGAGGSARMLLAFASTNKLDALDGFTQTTAKQNFQKCDRQEHTDDVFLITSRVGAKQQLDTAAGAKQEQQSASADSNFDISLHQHKVYAGYQAGGLPCRGQEPHEQSFDDAEGHAVSQNFLQLSGSHDSQFKIRLAWKGRITQNGIEEELVAPFSSAFCKLHNLANEPQAGLSGERYLKERKAAGGTHDGFAQSLATRELFVPCTKFDCELDGGRVQRKFRHIFYEPVHAPDLALATLRAKLRAVSGGSTGTGTATSTEYTTVVAKLWDLYELVRFCPTGDADCSDPAKQSYRNRYCSAFAQIKPREEHDHREICTSWSHQKGCLADQRAYLDVPSVVTGETGKIAHSIAKSRATPWICSMDTSKRFQHDWLSDEGVAKSCSVDDQTREIAAMLEALSDLGEMQRTYDEGKDEVMIGRTSKEDSGVLNDMLKLWVDMLGTLRCCYHDMHEFQAAFQRAHWGQLFSTKLVYLETTMDVSYKTKERRENKQNLMKTKVPVNPESWFTRMHLKSRLYEDPERGGCACLCKREAEEGGTPSGKKDGKAPAPMRGACRRKDRPGIQVQLHKLSRTPLHESSFGGSSKSVRPSLTVRLPGSDVEQYKLLAGDNDSDVLDLETPTAAGTKNKTGTQQKKEVNVDFENRTGATFCFEGADAVHAFAREGVNIDLHDNQEEGNLTPQSFGFYSEGSSTVHVASHVEASAGIFGLSAEVVVPFYGNNNSTALNLRQESTTAVAELFEVMHADHFKKFKAIFEEREGKTLPDFRKKIRLCELRLASEHVDRSRCNKGIRSNPRCESRLGGYLPDEAAGETAEEMAAETAQGHSSSFSSTCDFTPPKHGKHANVPPQLLAGDERASWNALSLSMHTIFARSHNKICQELRTMMAPKARDWMVGRAEDGNGEEGLFPEQDSNVPQRTRRIPYVDRHHPLMQDLYARHFGNEYKSQAEEGQHKLQKKLKNAGKVHRRWTFPYNPQQLTEAYLAKKAALDDTPTGADGGAGAGGAGAGGGDAGGRSPRFRVMRFAKQIARARKTMNSHSTNRKKKKGRWRQLLVHNPTSRKRRGHESSEDDADDAKVVQAKQNTSFEKWRRMTFHPMQRHVAQARAAWEARLTKQGEDYRTVSGGFKLDKADTHGLCVGRFEYLSKQVKHKKTASGAMLAATQKAHFVELYDHFKRWFTQEQELQEAIEEELYQMARDANIVIYQHIAKHQYAPNYGTDKIRKYFTYKKYYDHKLKAVNIPNHFSILYRLHSLMPDSFLVTEPQGIAGTNDDNRMYSGYVAAGSHPTPKTSDIVESLMKPHWLANLGLGAVLQGMSQSPAKTQGLSVIDALRNLPVRDFNGTLFPHDLTAMDIERGRERELPAYNEICEIHARWWLDRWRPKWKDSKLWHTENALFGPLLQELFVTMYRRKVCIGPEMTDNKGLTFRWLQEEFMRRLRARERGPGTKNETLFGTEDADKLALRIVQGLHHKALPSKHSATNFQAVTQDQEVRNILRDLYKSVESLESYVAGFVEDKVDGYSFSRLQAINLMLVATLTVFDGDRYTFKEQTLDLPQILEPRTAVWKAQLSRFVERYSTFGKVIRANTAVRCMQDDPFKVPHPKTNPVVCDDSGTAYDVAWRRCVSSYHGVNCKGKRYSSTGVAGPAAEAEKERLRKCAKHKCSGASGNDNFL
eukprot:g1507.t1